MLSVADKTAYLFNKLYFDLIKDVKKNCESIKPVLKANYKAVKLFDHGLIEEYSSFVKDALPTMTASTTDHTALFDCPEVMDAHVFKEVTLRSIVEHMPKGTEDTVKSYLYIFATLSMIYSQKDAELSELTLQVLAHIQNQADSTSINGALDNILDDDVVHLLKQLQATFCAESVKIDTEPESPLDFDETFKNSKIGTLAKEITDEMDLKDVKPEELLNLSNMGNIVNKVGSKIQSKINSGELRQEDLAQEVFSFMGAMSKGGPGNFLNNPLMKEMMKNVGGMMGGGGGAKTQVNSAAVSQKMKAMSTQDRLRKKLDERKNAKTQE